MVEETPEQKEEREKREKLKALIREAVREEIADQQAAAKKDKKKHWTEF